MAGALLAAAAVVRAAAPEEAGTAVASAVAFGGAGEATRVVVALDAEVPFNVFPLDGPPRIVIDMADVAFAIDGGGPDPDAGGLVADWRYGEIAPGRARIVLETRGSALPERAFFLPSLEGDGGRLVVDLARAAPDAFRAAVAAAPAPARPGPAPPVPPRVPAGSDRPLVVIDPGHGGIDPGAVAPSGVHEKELTLSFSQTLGEILRARGGIDVRLTRDDDRFLSLSRRVEIARTLGADLFISIHADAAPQAYVRGATVYTLSERPSDAQAAFMAARENRSDALAGLPVEEAEDEVVDILADLARRETLVFSRRFADMVVEALGESVRLINNNPHRSARFRVLKAHDVPSVLVEIGYLSNADDAELMRQPGWRLLAANAVASAVEAFFAETRLAGEPAPAD